MAWSLFLFRTVDGMLGRQLDVPDLSWSRGVGSASMAGGVGASAAVGTSAVSLRLPWSAFEADGVMPDPAALNDMLMPRKRGLVLMWDGVPWVAGLIGERTDDLDGTSFPVESLSSLLSARLATPNVTTGLAKSRSHWSGLSRGTLAKRVVQAGLERGGLPITFEADEAGSHSLTLPGFDLGSARVSDVLRRIVEDEDGPDVDFRPYLTQAGTLAWRMVTGTEASPFISQAVTHALDMSHLVAFRQIVSASRVAHRVWGTGAGQDEGTLLARVSDTDALEHGWPLLEAVVSDTSADSQARVDALARAHLLAFRRPLAQWEATIRADGPVPLGALVPGDAVTLHVRDFPTIPDGNYLLRVMEMSGNTGMDVRVVFDVIPAIH